MSTNTVFQDLHGKVMTPSQSKSAHSYTELNFVDSQLKTKITIRNKEVFGASYYMSQNENLNDVLGNLDRELEWYINLNKETINGYTIWESRAVIGGSLTDDFDKIVYGVDAKVIAAFSYDSNGSVTDAVKFFYLNGLPIIDGGKTIGYFGENDKVAFRFNATEIDEISTNTELFYKPYTYLQRFMEEWQDRTILNTMTADMIAYYTNILPLAPRF